MLCVDSGYTPAELADYIQFEVLTLLKYDVYPEYTIREVDMRGEVIVKADAWLSEHKMCGRKF
ncbi:hypothetical protein EON63_24215 [archaeon]|nr:MAG: hypothetical protein EON63_24215 [archaeon]